MFIGINSQLRRDMLRAALHEFIDDNASKVINLTHVTPELERLGVMLQDARKLLREIAASENLLRQPATHEVPHTQE